MTTAAENLAKLLCSQEYEAACASYTNKFRHGAGRQKPGSKGFALWLLYDIYARDHNNIPPTKSNAQTMAREHGLNETSAANALRKWSAHNEFTKPLTGQYAIGPRS